MKLPDGISHFFQVDPHQVTIGCEAMQSYSVMVDHDWMIWDPGLDTWRETIQFLGVGKTLPISKT